MKQLLAILFLVFLCEGIFSQNVMNVYQCNGNVLHLPTACIDSITYSTYNLPAVTTASVTITSMNTATSGGSVTSDGGTPVTARGVCWGTSPNPVVSVNFTSNGSGLGAFTSYINGLSGATTYYVRAYATNLMGTAYGNEFSFTTTSSGSGVVDIDGNLYNTIIIGTQEWMLENLRTTHYRSGQPILEVEDSASWASYEYPSNGAIWCHVNGDSSNNATYGKLYNWYVVAYTNPLQVCPVGWHTPVDSEFTQLVTYLGGASTAGTKLKATGYPGWNGSNTSGFTALPAASRDHRGWFGSLGATAVFWSATDEMPFPSDSDQPGGLALFSNYNIAQTPPAHSKYDGCSIRCIKD